LFSPRAHHVYFSLEYIAENLDAPTTVLQYPSRRELIRELQNGYDHVGVSFNLATFHRMMEVVELIRQHSPGSKIILGGYGTVLSDDQLAAWSDHICREEGVAYMRKLLGERSITMPYRHPLIVSRMRVFGMEASRTGMVFAGLGCPNGCDFCCTSHFFKRRHIRLLPTGRDIHAVIERYHEMDPEMPIVVLDEDFLLNKKRAMEFRECVVQAGKPLSLFVFASIKAISQYSVEQILEMGIDGMWIGYEGTRSGYAKQEGKPVAQLFGELRQHGVGLLTSMIVGFPYQTPKIIAEELDGLLALKPDLAQFLIYGPTPGTPFHERVLEEGLLHKEYVNGSEHYYRRCTGFTSMVRHQTMSPATIEAAQERCFEQDFKRLGPSILRTVETWLLGYESLRRSDNTLLQKKAQRIASDIRRAYPVFLAGWLLAPSSGVRHWVADLQARVHKALGRPSMAERLESGIALLMAMWTGLTLKLGLFQHPRLIRHTFRMPQEAAPSRPWHALRNSFRARHWVDAEQRPESMVWVRVEGKLAFSGAERLVRELVHALRESKDRLVLDFARLMASEPAVLKKLAEGLGAYRSRIRIILPKTGELAILTALFALY
jgi:haloalkane dehalogenase